MNKLDELKKQYASLGEEIRKLESEPDGFLGIKKGDDYYYLYKLIDKGKYFLSVGEVILTDKNAADVRERGYLNCFKTREQAEVARYVLIYLFLDIKKTLEENISLSDKYNFMFKEGTKITKELGLV